MFNKNKKLTDDLNNRIIEYKTAADKIKKQASDIKSGVSSLMEQHDDQLEDMQEMEKSIQEKGTVTPEIDHSTGVLKSGLSLLIEKDKSSKDNNALEKQRWEQSIDKFNEFSEIRHDYSTVLEDVKSPMRAVDKTATECSSLIREMSALSQNMSVAALNSAIEAGHLGDVGTRYVETAEKLRIMSEEYKAHADGAEEKLDAMMDLFNRTQDALLHLGEISKKEETELKKITQLLENNLEECKRYNGMEEMLSADSLKSEMENLEQLLATDRENRNMLYDKLQYIMSGAEKNHEDWKNLSGGVETLIGTVNDLK